jgi:DNA-directed RNA polymerase II subunit RPB1
VSAQDVLEIFSRIGDDDIKLLGFNPQWCRPEWLILRVIPVPPMAVRPAAVFNGGEENHDDLTYMLANIVKANLSLANARGEDDHNRREKEDLLQYTVTTLFNNEVGNDLLPLQRQKSGRALKSVRQRLKGKSGRVRSHLMGKRVNFSARSVITADPNLDIDEVGVPRSIAKILTFPEVIKNHMFISLSFLE